MSSDRKRHFDADYREEVELRDGTTAVMRLVRPDDKELFVQGLERLSPESRYFRFFTSKDRLSAWELRYFTEVDQESHFAFGAMRTHDSGEIEPLAVARFVRFKDEPDVAEAAIVVVDDAQGLGLGRTMFLRLIEAARERGVQTFRADVLMQNDGMRKLLGQLAPIRSENPDGPSVVVDLDLTQDDDKYEDDAVYRVFRLVAEQLISIRRIIEGLVKRDEPSKPERDA
ncbi:MAG: GNAT family N-acetyltransferase [Myxococcota bacterium]